MTQQIINVGNVANDGQGTPLRTAFQYINNNFAELYTGNVSVNVTSIANGTSNINIATANSNVTVGVGGTSNVMVVSPSLVAIKGDLSVTGNAILSGNIVGDRLVNGTTEVSIQTPGGNANISVGGISNLIVFASTGEYVTGLISATGNITGGNILTAGLISATGNVNVGNLINAGLTSVTGNITGGNILTAGLISATGNVNVGNLINAGLTSVTGNITGGNILTAGKISATGNVTGNYFIGNGSQLTDITVAAGTAIVNGTSNVSVGAGGNATISIAGTSNVAVFSTTGEYVTGLISATGNIYGANIIGNITIPAGSPVSTTGNVTAGNILTSGLVSATGNVRGGNILTAGQISSTGNITAGGLVGTIYTNSIVNTGANATGNIGATGNYFNTVFATATTALYADLAEKYLADQDYEIGTVLSVGGSAEVTACAVGDRAIGAVSENPAYRMNDGLANGTLVALKGRVPVMVIGTVHKGQRLVAHNNGCAVAVRDHNNDVFAISLENSDDSNVKLIEAVIL
jgi:hypothetical protein